MAAPADATVMMPAEAGWPRFGSGTLGGVVLALIAVPCFVTLPWSLQYYDVQRLAEGMQLGAPTVSNPMGTDALARSVLWRCLLGGAISLGIGIASAAISVGIGVTWGALSGYAGGRTDAVMMRIVDVLYGLPYILLVVLLDLALKPSIHDLLVNAKLSADVAAGAADVLTLLLAIGGISWLTMARVIRGQVLSLRTQPFIEAARACGSGPGRIFFKHLLPNLVGPIIVYATLTVPVAILQESFLSFLGIGLRAPVVSWGVLLQKAQNFQAVSMAPWLLLPGLFVVIAVLSFNVMGDGMRDAADPYASR